MNQPFPWKQNEFRDEVSEADSVVLMTPCCSGDMFDGKCHHVTRVKFHFVLTQYLCNPCSL